MASINLLVCCRFFLLAFISLTYQFLYTRKILCHNCNSVFGLRFVRLSVCTTFSISSLCSCTWLIFFTSALNSIVVSMIILSRLCYIFVVVVVFLPLFFVLILCSIHRQRYVLWYCFFFCSPFDLQFGLLTGRLNQSSIIKFTY